MSVVLLKVPITPVHLNHSAILRLITLVWLALFGGGLLAAPAFAVDAPAEDEQREGFFSYLPAPPKLSIPKIRIPFWSDDLKTARRAYDKGNYSKAQEFFQRASEDGNMVADWYLGHMYRTGRGVPQDDGKAFDYYSRVVRAYDPEDDSNRRLRIMIDADIRLADYYRIGSASADIKRDYARAYDTYMKYATAYGHPAAFYGLGFMNVNGQGVNRNARQGLKWMMAGARKRYPPAEAFMGDAYWTGRLVQQDKTRALMFYILAAQSATQDEFPDVFDRLELMRAASREDIQLEAEARAKVFDSQFPIQGNE